MFHPNWTYAFAPATHPGMQAHDRCESLMQRHNRRAAHGRTVPNAIAEPDAIATDGRTHSVRNAHAVHSTDEFADARASNAAAFSSTLVAPIARANARPDPGAERTTTPEHCADRTQVAWAHDSRDCADGLNGSVGSDTRADFVEPDSQCDSDWQVRLESGVLRTLSTAMSTREHSSMSNPL